jgi:hypothetical protein
MFLQFQILIAGLRLGRIDYFKEPATNNQVADGHALKFFKSQ